MTTSGGIVSGERRAYLAGWADRTESTVYSVEELAFLHRSIAARNPKLTRPETAEDRQWLADGYAITIEHKYVPDKARLLASGTVYDYEDGSTGFESLTDEALATELERRAEGPDFDFARLGRAAHEQVRREIAREKAEGTYVEPAADEMVAV